VPAHVPTSLFVYDDLSRSKFPILRFPILLGPAQSWAPRKVQTTVPEVPPQDDRRPRIAITVGDVAGVGTELALRCAVMSAVTERCTPILYGPETIIAEIAETVGLDFGGQICSVGTIDKDGVRPGVFSAETGQASFDAVSRAIGDAVDGRVDAIVTGPIQKEAWHAAGIDYPGHTELLADRLGVADYCMMLTSESISCVLATIHIPLADVPRALSTEAILRAIRLGGVALTRRLKRPARVTVCGLNPHAGENGLLSHGEETELIEPAVVQARQLGIDARGPLSPDSAFTPAVRLETDVYVCMYHDQGLIPLKALAFDDAVNVTLGLPIVRTSVDHGTALDLAWQGKASHRSMLAAIQMAIELADG
jgi:4-hydroxythreonine-4-phosphate dehydrogenase